jgi:hypothetical protein
MKAPIDATCSSRQRPRDVAAAARVAATNAVLDRGWGRPQQRIDADIKVVPPEVRERQKAARERVFEMLERMENEKLPSINLRKTPLPEPRIASRFGATAASPGGRTAAARLLADLNWPANDQACSRIFAAAGDGQSGTFGRQASAIPRDGPCTLAMRPRDSRVMRHHAAQCMRP